MTAKRSQHLCDKNRASDTLPRNRPAPLRNSEDSNELLGIGESSRYPRRAKIVPVAAPAFSQTETSYVLVMRLSLRAD